MTHPFEIELETTLPARPEQVWAAIATGPGIDSWFMGRNEVEPREGGVAAMDTGGHREEAVITAYEPGKRIATRTGTAEHSEYYAKEQKVILRDGNATLVDSRNGTSSGAELTYWANDDRLLVNGSPTRPAESRIKRKK